MTPHEQDEASAAHGPPAPRACTEPGSLQFGVCVLATDRGISPPRLAREVEARGIDMLFLPENSHIPLDRSRDWPNIDGVLDPLSRLYDPFVALSAAAAVTDRLLLGFAVCLLTHRDPINTAKAVASLDLLSHGRVILGVAGGALDVAMRNHGTEFKHRWRVVRERVLAMRTIWTEEAAEFSGEFVDFGPLLSYPKPLQLVGPPIWIGSNSKWVPGRVADYADGWIVYNGRYQGDAIADLREACLRKERDFAELTLALMDAPWEDDAAARFLEHGYRKLIFLVPPSADIEAALDRIAEIAGGLRLRFGG
jgi:probable F420-dependent oxidoreductase